MKKFLVNRKSESGFTLIELLVVVIIIAILAAIAVPVYIGIQDNAKHSALQADVATTKTNIAAAFAEDGTVASGTYATSAKDGDAQIQNSGVGNDEVVTVAVNADNSFTVSAKSASLNYTASADSATGQQTGQSGPTAQDLVTVGTKIIGTIAGVNGQPNYIMLTGPATINAYSWPSWQQGDGSSTLPTISTFPDFNNVAKYSTNYGNTYNLVGLYDVNGTDITHALGGNCFQVLPRVQYHYYTDGIAAGLILNCNNDVSQTQMDNIGKIVISNGSTNYTFAK